MILYAIREKGTNKYLPNGFVSSGRLRQRGFSWCEPVDNLQPRLFIREVAAKNALAAWLRGHIVKKVYSNSFEGEYLKDEPQPHRKRENMEIVKFKLVEIK